LYHSTLGLRVVKKKKTVKMDRRLWLCGTFHSRYHRRPSPSGALHRGLRIKAHRRFYHSTLGLRVVKKKKTVKIDRRCGTGAGSVGSSTPETTAALPIRSAAQWV